MGKDYRAEADTYERGADGFRSTHPVAERTVAPTGEPGNGENTTPKSIIDLLLVLDS